MIRKLAALLLVMLGFASAGPVAAQSLGLVAMPVVIVAHPVVDPLEGQKVFQPGEAARLARGASSPALRPARTPQERHGADFVGVRPIVVQPTAPSAATPRRTAIVAVDRSARDYRRAIAAFGPFVVLDSQRAALMGETGRGSPAAFAAMLRAYPHLRQLDMIECPGTQDDLANMKLGRMIRAANIATHVPAKGSVRSGAVELFLAGAVRDIADGAEFAVHSWMDDYGREARDFAADSPENRKYIAYYREMGMSEAAARTFYDFTNSVPHGSARWLEAREMRRWIESGDGRADAELARAEPTLS